MAKAPKSDAPAARYDLSALIGELHGKYGKNIALPASELPHFRHIPTGIFTLDMALLGGVPESLITMFYGWESSGKTTVAMRVVGNAMKKYPDKKVVFIDAEGTFMPDWAKTHGIDCTRCIVLRPESGEQAVDIGIAALKADDVSMVVLDSLPALMPTKIQDQSAEDMTVAVRARLIDLFISKANDAMLDERKQGHYPTLLIINQFRSRITLMGDPRTLPGGNALKFFVSNRVELLNKETTGRDSHDVETVDFNEHSFKITKNKVGNSLRTGEFTMIRNPSHPLGPGFIDDARTVLTYARKFGVFTGGGASWRIDDVDQKFGRMQEAADYLYSDLEYYEKLKHRLISIQREHAGLPSEGWYL